MNDYSKWSISRNKANCYQGLEVYYWKKNVNAMCFDNRTASLNITKSCPCYLEDFQCRFNYYYIHEYCSIETFSDFNDDNCQCELGTYPLSTQNGFATLDPGVCKVNAPNLIKNTTNAVVCISHEYLNQIQFISIKYLFIYELDYIGNPWPKFRKQFLLIPYKMNPTYPMSIDMVNRDVYYFFDHTLLVYKHKDDIFSKHELYEFGFNILSIEMDHHRNFVVILDSNQNLFVLCIQSNFVKLLAPNVNDFYYSPHNLSISFIKNEQLCFYRFYLGIECFITDFDVMKFMYSEDFEYYLLLLRNKTLLVYEVMKIKFIKTTKAVINISNVTFFDIIKHNLFLIQKGSFIRIDLRYPTRLDLLSDRDFSDLIQFRLDVVYSEDAFKNSKQLYKYRCNPLIKSDDFCFDEEIKSDHKHICQKHDIECLRRYCAGFQCGSSECITNNVRCNGINECRDGSDEMNCESKSLYHLKYVM
ncbi:hypothetical protein RF11_15103 [Thelohanellus kitauei]|uniref:Sortilin C-terminal domain-containing protein n=1 Tax=Thelohanellus kitauei TaxID=669202 RepID=A0A0C2N3W6_THEKT|nr:hypothetical protein RF11_15103 [Thelohanellus kitauei]